MAGTAATVMWRVKMTRGGTSRKIFTIIKNIIMAVPVLGNFWEGGFWRLRVNSILKSCSNYLKVFVDRNISCLRIRTVQLQNTGDQEE